MAFGDTGILDDFNRSDEGPPPSASWTNDIIIIGQSRLVVSSNAVVADSVALCDAYWNVETFGPACEVFAAINTKGGSNEEYYVFTRLVNIGVNTTDGYFAYWQVRAGTDYLKLYRVDNGQPTQLGSTESIESGVGDILGLESDENDVHTGYYDTGSGWTACTSATATDTAYQSAGYIGLAIEKQTWVIDDFGGGTIGGVSDYSVDPTPEAVTVGDTATVDPLLLADVSETEDVIVGDTPTLELASYISEQDDVTVGDTATVDPVSSPIADVSDAVTVGDTATLEPLVLSDISETDDVTVGDTATIEPLIIDISESEAVTVGDAAALSPVAPTDVSESEAVTVGDTPTVQIPSEEVWNISESDGVTVVDAATLAPVTPTDIDVSDAVTVTDTPTVQRVLEDEWNVSEADAVTVGETVTVYLTTDISESEAITVGDSATLTLDLADVIEAEAVTVVDTPTLGPVTPTEISEVEAVTVADTATVAFFQPILTLSVGDAVTVLDLSTVEFPSDLLGLDKPEKKPYEYQKEFLDMEPVARPDPLFAMRQEQQSIMKANQVAESLWRQNDAEAARRVESMLAREKADKDKADRRRASSLHNLAKAQIAKEAKANKQAEINKVRKKSLKKARAAKKRKAKKK